MDRQFIGIHLNRQLQLRKLTNGYQQIVTSEGLGLYKLLCPKGVTIDTLPLFLELLIPLGFACFLRGLMRSFGHLKEQGIFRSPRTISPSVNCTQRGVSNCVALGKSGG